MDKKRKRGNNYTAGEKRVLLELIKKYENIIESKESNASTILKKREAWESLCCQYNVVACSGSRTWKQLCHFYDNIKQKAKKNIAERLQSYEKTEGSKKDSILDVVMHKEAENRGSDAAMSFDVIMDQKDYCENTSNNCGCTKPNRKNSDIRQEYFKAKLRNANLENRYLINKNKMEVNKYKLELEILKFRLKNLQSSYESSIN